MATQFYNAWENVVALSTYRLYCSLYVLKARNDNLAKVKDEDKRNKVSFLVETVQQELDPTRFEILLTDAVEKLQNNKDT